MADVDDRLGIARLKLVVARALCPGGPRTLRSDIEVAIVFEWLDRIRRVDGDLAVRRIIGWAAHTPMRVLGKRELCSGRTVANRIDRSLAKLLLSDEKNERFP
jgi:hypothetical protein